MHDCEEEEQAYSANVYDDTEPKSKTYHVVLL